MMKFSKFSAFLPFREIVAYEALWANKASSFRSLASLFGKYPGSKPSDFVKSAEISEFYTTIKGLILNADRSYKTNTLIHGMDAYPKGLRDAQDPVELLYYTGDQHNLATRCISIVGSSRPSPKNLELAADLAAQFVENDFTIVSGLTGGIDTQALSSAIHARGRTIAVIGTPLNMVFPMGDAKLQDIISRDHLLISLVPFYRYTQQGVESNKVFLSESKKTMSALTEATVIIEANDDSDTLIQALAALQQGRKLFIWNNCFLNREISWPARFLENGAIRVSHYEEMKEVLSDQPIPALKTDDFFY